MANYSDKSLGELKAYWESVKQEAVKRLAHIDALLALETGGAPTTPSPQQQRAAKTTRNKAKGRRKRRTIQQSLEAILPELVKPVLQADLLRKLEEHGVKASRQSISIAVGRLVEQGKLMAREAPEGSFGPYVYGRPDMFRDREALTESAVRPES